MTQGTRNILVLLVFVAINALVAGILWLFCSRGETGSCTRLEWNILWEIPVATFIGVVIAVWTLKKAK